MSLQKFILSFSAVAFLVQGSLSGSITPLFLDEVEAVDRAICAMEKRLAVQREVKNLMLELRGLEEDVVNSENPKEHAARMVGLAEKILAIIQEEHLDTLFSAPYLEELRFYSSFARKTSLAPKT